MCAGERYSPNIIILKVLSDKISLRYIIWRTANSSNEKNVTKGDFTIYKSAFWVYNI